jgi:hypothetical protein
MKKALTVLVLMAVAAGVSASPVSAGGASVSADPPLRLKIVSPNGKPKLKADSKLTTVLGCNVDCYAKVRYVLRMPVGKLSNGGGRSLTGGSFWLPSMTLNGVATNYLKQNYRNSTMKVVLTARDLKTGARETKTRIFGFYR